MTRLSVSLSPDLDQSPDVVGLEHQETEQVRALRVAGAETAGHEAERLRQPGLEAAGELPQVLGGSQQHEVDEAERTPRSDSGIRASRPFIEFHPVRVLVELIQEHGVQEHARELGRRRVGGWPPSLGARGSWRVDTAIRRSQPRCRAGDSGEVRTHSAVAVPGVADPHRREDQRQRGGGEDVVEREQGVAPSGASAVPRSRCSRP